MQPFHCSQNKSAGMKQFLRDLTDNKEGVSTSRRDTSWRTLSAILPTPFPSLHPLCFTLESSKFQPSHLQSFATQFPPRAFQHQAHSLLREKHGFLPGTKTFSSSWFLAGVSMSAGLPVSQKARWPPSLHLFHVVRIHTEWMGCYPSSRQYFIKAFNPDLPTMVSETSTAESCRMK